MAKKREYEWFLEPCGDTAYSNQIISKYIGIEENAMQGALCADGQKHDLWRCPSGKVFMLWRSRENFGRKFKIRIFCREGEGKIRNVTVLFKNESGGKKTKKQKNAPRDRF